MCVGPNSVTAGTSKGWAKCRGPESVVTKVEELERSIAAIGSAVALQGKALAEQRELLKTITAMLHQRTAVEAKPPGHCAHS